MSRLPLKPDLEHLKAQAKRLLRAYQTQDPEALHRVTESYPGLAGKGLKLADAQWLVAREYGFPSWGRLKTYVEAHAASGTLPHTHVSSLTALGEGRNAGALREAFAAMPLQDILKARETLTQTGDIAAVIDTLIAGLAHPKPRVRFNCAGALDHLADARCAEPLGRLLDDPVPRVRRAALHSLSCDACKLVPLTTPEAFVPALVEMALHDPSIRVRRVAAVSLEAYAYDAKALDALRRLAKDPDLTIMRTTTLALRQLGG